MRSMTSHIFPPPAEAFPEDDSRTSDDVTRTSSGFLWLTSMHYHRQPAGVQKATVVLLEIGDCAAVGGSTAMSGS